MTGRRPRGGSALGVIGWNEYVGFPDWGIEGVKAKVDTGARTSAIHVAAVRRLAGNRVRFDVVLKRKANGRRVTVEAPVVRRTRVRSSMGHHRTRHVVSARVRIGDVEKTIELSLVSREKMLFRMLLGRSAFSGDFLIDASRTCLLGPEPEAQPKRRARPVRSRA